MTTINRVLSAAVVGITLLCCTGSPNILAQTRLADFRKTFAPKKSLALTPALSLSATTFQDLDNGDFRLGSSDKGREVLAWFDINYAHDVTATIGDKPGLKVIQMKDLHAGILASHATVSVPDKTNGIITVRLEDAVICQTGDRNDVILVTLREGLYHDELVGR